MVSDLEDIPDLSRDLSNGQIHEAVIRTGL